MVVSGSFPLHSQESRFPSQPLPASHGSAGSQGLPGAWRPVPVVRRRLTGPGVLAGGLPSLVLKLGSPEGGPARPLGLGGCTHRACWAGSGAWRELGLGSQVRLRGQVGGPGQAGSARGSGGRRPPPGPGFCKSLGAGLGPREPGLSQSKYFFNVVLIKNRIKFCVLKMYQMFAVIF